MKHGAGSTVDRNSQTVHGDFFYSATYFPRQQLIIRSALPYTSDLVQSLQADQHYIWFAVGAIMLLNVIVDAKRAHRHLAVGPHVGNL